MLKFLKWAFRAFFSPTVPTVPQPTGRYTMVVKQRKPVDVSAFCKEMYDLANDAKADDLELCMLETDLQEFRRTHTTNYSEFLQLNAVETRLRFLRSKIESPAPNSSCPK